jgi:4-amino-4-deoxy-L-arabinose transferase-like glycosyltransferase
MTTELPSDRLNLHHVELILFWSLLIGKFTLFFSRLGVMFGYDDAEHLHAMTLISWLHPFFDLRSFYYASHPPLGFLLAKTVSTLTYVSPLIGVQIVSFIASIAAFLFLRETLIVLKLMDRPAAVAFLYIAAALPLQSYMQAGVNLDVIIFAFACAILYVSVRMAHSIDQHVFSPHVRLLGLLIAAACLTKESGFLLLPIPFIVVLVLQRERFWLMVRRSLAMALLASVLVVPYYVVNYVIPEGTFFYMAAGNTAWVEDMRLATAERDRDFSAFVLSFVQSHNNGLEPRLLRTWRGVWRMEDRQPQSPAAAGIISFYLIFSPLLVFLGAIFFVRRFRWNDAWSAFGVILLLIFSLELLFLLCFVFRYPLDGYFHNKMIYIAPASLGIAYLLSALWELPAIAFVRRPVARFQTEVILFSLLFVYLVANAVIPVF